MAAAAGGDAAAAGRHATEEELEQQLLDVLHHRRAAARPHQPSDGAGSGNAGYHGGADFSHSNGGGGGGFQPYPDAYYSPTDSAAPRAPHARRAAAISSFPTTAIVVVAVGSSLTVTQGANFNLSFQVFDTSGAGMITSIPLPSAPVGNQAACTLSQDGQGGAASLSVDGSTGMLGCMNTPVSECDATHTCHLHSNTSRA
jgi:hypothetical protein